MSPQQVFGARLYDARPREMPSGARSHKGLARAQRPPAVAHTLLVEMHGHWAVNVRIKQSNDGPSTSPPLLGRAHQSCTDALTPVRLLNDECVDFQASEAHVPRPLP